jgi:phosphohistidine phosphatase
MTVRLDLILLRHGQAEDLCLGQDDHSRKLTKTGRDEASATARGLSARALIPGIILSSDAQRTRDTSEEVAGILGPKSPSVVLDPHLYHASLQSILSLLAKRLEGHARALVIGHNPTLSQLVGFLTGERTQLATAEAAHLSVDGLAWAPALAAPGIWTLEGVWRG